MNQGGKHCVGKINTDGFICYQRWNVFSAIEMITIKSNQPTGRLDNVIKSRMITVGAILTKACGKAIDKLRVDSTRLLVAKSKPFDRFNPHVVNKHLTLSDQTTHDFPAFVTFHIDRKRALVAINRNENRTHAFVARYTISTHQITLRRFDLNDIRPQIPQNMGCDRPEDDRG